jgi:hypothetical protein
MRIVPLILCASLAGACFATEPLKIGELGSEVPDTQDKSVPEPAPIDASVAQEEDAALPSALDAGRARETSDDDHERDAGEHEDSQASLSDAALSDAGYVMEAGADAGHDAGSGTDSGANDAGSDAARSLLCTLEPWHCP